MGLIRSPWCDNRARDGIASSEIKDQLRFQILLESLAKQGAGIRGGEGRQGAERDKKGRSPIREGGRGEGKGRKMNMKERNKRQEGEGEEGEEAEK